MRIADRAAHEASGVASAVTLPATGRGHQRDGQGFLILEIGRKQQSARHRAAKGGRGNGIAVMTANGLIDEIRGDPRHKRARRRPPLLRDDLSYVPSYIKQIRFSLNSKIELHQHFFRVDVKNADFAVFRASRPCYGRPHASTALLSPD